MRRTGAFTVVEILITITIIAILSSIAIITFDSVREDSRNSARQGNATIISEGLEKYYEQNGEYPSVASIANTQPGNTGEAVATKLSIPVSSLVMPLMPSGTTNGITAGPEPENDYLAYEASSAKDNISCQNDVNGGCDTYKLRYLEEGTGEVREIASRHAWRSTDSTPELVVAATGPSSINAVWTEIPGASSYTLQRSLSADMSSSVTTTHSSTSTTASGLAADTEYFFAVRASTPNGLTDWSEVESATTSGLTAPTGTITITAAMSGTSARGTASGGTCTGGSTIEYQIRYRVNGGAWAGWATGTPRNVAATEGYMYTFQAQARCRIGSLGGPWVLSTTASVTRSVNAPSGLTITAAMSGTNARGTAGGGVCGAGTTIQRQIRYSGTSTTTDSYVAYTTGTPRDVAANQGWRYTFQQQARCVGANTSSGWATSGTAAVVRPISTTSAPALSSSASSATGTVTWSWSIGCPTGTSARYRFIRTSSELGYNSGWSAETTGKSYSWANAGGYNLTLQAQARCVSVHTGGAWSASATRSHIAPVATPAAPTGFSYYLRSDRYWDQWTWNNPTCGSGARPEFYENSYLSGAGWYWVETGKEGWRYGTGWSSPRKYMASPLYGTYNNPAYPSNSSNIKVQHKAYYVCVNTTTGRVSANGAVGSSPLTTVPSW